MIKLDYQETWYEKAEREKLETPSPNGGKPLTEGKSPASAEAEQLLQAALEKVESSSIRQWATSEHNRPIFLQIADLAIQKQQRDGKPDVYRFSSFIISAAIGL